MPVPDAPPPYGTVVFDCDSTLSTIEGIEELARLAGRHEAELATLTDQAMNGIVPLEEVYGRRLELIRPTRAEVEAVGERYVATQLPNAGRLIASLRELGKRVAIVSGGVLSAVLRLGEALGLGPEDVFAVELSFAPDGSYAGFDEASPLARAGGKVEVVRALAATSPGAVALVGDGATDLEAAGEVARFVAFGGVERRGLVFAEAAVTCAAPDFLALAPLLLTPAELDDAGLV